MTGKNAVASCALNFDAADLPYCLNRYTQRNPKTTQHMTWCQLFGVQGFPDSGPPKQAILRCFFAQKLISWPNGQFLLMSRCMVI